MSNDENNLSQVVTPARASNSKLNEDKRDSKAYTLDHTAIQTLQEKAACVLENLAITELFAAVSEMHRSLRILLSFFLFWVILVKCRPRAKGEEFLKTKRGFCS